MNEGVLNFSLLLHWLKQLIEQLDDPRQPSNGTKFQLKDIVLGAFAVFFMQCPSFLEHQRQVHSRHGHDNAQTLFDLEELPTSNQIKNVLDLIAVSLLLPIFHRIYVALLQRGHLEQYKVLDGHLLVGLDGSEYFSSKRICCEQCSTKTHRDESITYTHTAVLPVLVSPGIEHVISLAPEFIRPQDGAEKQDSETAAAKRWIKTHSQGFDGTKITALGDDLYSRQPMVETCLEDELNFIFVCLPSSHPELYEWVDYLEGIGDVEHLETRGWNGRYHEICQYRYCNRVPLREELPTVMVNWCEVFVTRAADGKQMYHNTFITHHHINDQSVAEIVSAGRARWKGENEGHNVLKTKGYHLEHNFGHGQNNLAAVLLVLNLLAFLFHTVLHMVDSSYQRMRKQRGTRQGFFHDIQTLTKYLLFESWEHLLQFMLDDPQPRTGANTS
ncbi:ISNCY family transposase [Acaryochloris marina NIES-2412]|uniref:ISNCY family transposase n=1 Tax=Acaryochloris marina TaxID=155978 RepID=UPI0040595D77